MIKKEYMWDWGSEQKAAFEKAKILVKQVKALDLSHTELPFELYVPVTPVCMGYALWQR